MKFASSFSLSLLVLALNCRTVLSQSYSGCHSHGDVQYCYGPDGEETAVSSQQSAPSTTGPVSASATPTDAAQTAAITGCHKHGSQTFCIAGDGEEVQVTGSGTSTEEPPAQFTGCHSHGEEQFCLGPDGEEVQVLGSEGGEESSSSEGDAHEGQNCHFHAGVEHCVGAGESESGGSEPSCGRRDRDYNIPYRIGSLFVILVTSAIAVFGPILYARFFSAKINGTIFTIIKQFGTGIMLATAFIHLFTHSQLMFGNECLGGLKYEATTAAIALAGIFISFLIEYIGHRILLARDSSGRTSSSDVEPQGANKEPHEGGHDHPQAPALVNLGHHHHEISRPDDKLSVVVMEAGIIFHSIIIGITLIVAGDSGYTSLFIVIIFHQMFEGLALGARIAGISHTATLTKLIMAAIFALITPIGMAIGIGVIHKFNGNDPSTIIAIGTLDAFSAGILTWAAMIDMLSHDWLHGDLKDAGSLRTGVGIISLMAGMILMGLLGKWA